MDNVSSRAIGLAFAAAYVLISTLVGTVLVKEQEAETRPVVDAGGAVGTAITPTWTPPPVWPTTTRPQSTRAPTTTSRAPDREVFTAGNSLRVALPRGWTITTGSEPTTKVGKNPAYPGVEIRFGSAPPEEPAKRLFDRITTAHQSMVGKNSYVRNRLVEAASPRSTYVVEWEFSTGTGSNVRTNLAQYWEDGGNECIVYISYPPSQLTNAMTIFQYMTMNG